MSKPNEDTRETGEDSGSFIGKLGREIYGLAVVIGCVILFKSLAFSNYRIPSESMLPGLLTGDYLIVSKFSYGYSRHSFPFSLAPISERLLGRQPERGDVAVFKWNGDNRTDFIKRVIGLPGERIAVRGGQLFINEVAVPREATGYFEVRESPNTPCANPRFRVPLPQGALCRYPQYVETLPNGVQYPTLDLVPGSVLDDTPTFIVPEGHYFMMGDNRDASSDSRVSVGRGGAGNVPFRNLVGRADYRYLSVDGSARLLLPWTWFQAVRWPRVFDSVN